MPHYAVIDTNTWLDLLLFRNPGSNALAYALKYGWIHAIATEEMQGELAEVLQRPLFAGRHPNPPSLLNIMKKWVQTVPAADFLIGPACKDKADQKFIDLAVTYPAHFLISKDQAILRLAHRLTPCQTGVPELFQCVGTQPILLSQSRGKQQRILKLEFEENMLGQVTVQRWGSVALLRAFTVEPNDQYQAMGTALVQGAEAVARAAGAKSLYTFTENAQPFFNTLGYHSIDRAAAPTVLQHTEAYLHSDMTKALLMLKSLASAPAERISILS